MTGAPQKKLFKMRWKDVRSLRESYEGHSTLTGADIMANGVWREMGDKMGFVWNTAGPANGRDERYFMAVPK